MPSRLLSLAVILAIGAPILVPVTAFGASPIQTAIVGYEESCGLPVGGNVWLSGDGQLHGRGLQQTCVDVIPGLEFRGTATITINFNGAPQSESVVFAGPMWGTVTVSNTSGYWDSTWTGTHYADGASSIDVVAHGHGVYAGMLMWYHVERPAYQLGTITGVLLIPSG